MSTRAASIGRGELLRYSLLAAPIAFAGMPLYVHAPDYYATEFTLSLSTIGLILVLLRFVDAVQDPLIGRLSDRYAQHRLPIVLAASIMLVLGFAGVFHPQIADGSLVWFFVMMLMATTAFSTLSINLNTLGGLWSKDVHQKTRISSYRESCGLVGLLLAVLLPSMLMQEMPKAEAFAWVSAVLLCITAFGLVAFIYWHKNHSIGATQDQKTARPSLLQTIRTLPQTTCQFFFIYGVSMLASSIPALLVLFFIRDRLDAESYTALFLLLYFLSGAAGMPLWQYVSRRWTKHRAWMLAMLLAVVSFIWAFFLGEGDIWPFAIVCIFSGIAFGADLALPPSIVADHIHTEQNEHNASLQFGLLTFLAKAALAIASAIVFPLLDWTGFKAGADNSDAALLMLSFTYAAIPCAIKLLAILMLWRADTTTHTGDYHDHQTHLTTDRSRHHA